MRGGGGEDEADDVGGSDEGVVWYWKGDSEGGGHQDVWIRYSKEVCDAIEAARTAKQKEYKLDELRAISFKKMKQFVFFQAEDGIRDNER
eukprot:COSAG02_NODE_24537_length_685_cov_0.819113_2_plen_90_part_00